MSWDDTDLPVLRAVAEAELEGRVDLKAIIARTSLPDRPVKLALMRLLEAGLISGHPIEVAQEDLPVRIESLRTTLAGQQRLD